MIDIEFVHIRIIAHGDAYRDINFRPGLNVLVGPYGSGKSSLLELLKFALGGSSARLSEAVTNGVDRVVLDVRLARELFTFERRIGASHVDVRQHDELVASLHTTNGTSTTRPLASRFLLEQLGLPEIRMRRSARSTSTTTEPVSFWDIYRFIYVSQNDMGQSIAGHTDSNADRKRRRAIEAMFGLLTAEVAALELATADLSDRSRNEASRRMTVVDFLHAAGTPDLEVIDRRERDAEIRRQRASAGLAVLRESGRSSSEHLAPERDRIGALYGDLATVRRSIASVSAEIEERETFMARLRLQTAAVARDLTAQRLLGPFRFVQCPRCMQALAAQRGDEGHCELCLQPTEPSVRSDDEAESTSDTQEVARLDAVLDEAMELQLEDRRALQILERERSRIDREIRAFEERVAAATDSYVAPLFEEIATLTAEVGAADAEQASLEAQRVQWTALSAIDDELREIESELLVMKDRLSAERARLEEQRYYIRELSSTFDEIIQELGLVWYEQATVDEKTFLPRIGPAAFDKLSGGQRTVVSVAYHLALLTVSLVNSRELQLPNVVILDTPSKYLGKKDTAQVSRDYRRIAAIVDSYKGMHLQVIVADNDPPPVGVRPSSLIELSYENPLVPGLEHPGGSVARVHDPYDEDEDDD